MLPLSQGPMPVLAWLAVMAGVLVVQQSASPLQPTPAPECSKVIRSVSLPFGYTIHSVPVPILRRYIQFTPPAGATECLFTLDEVFGDTAFLNSSTYVQYFFHNQDVTNTMVAVHTVPGNFSPNPYISADLYFQNCTGGADAIAAVASVVDIVALLLWSEVPIRLPDRPDPEIRSLLCESVGNVATYLMVNTRSFDSCPFVFCRQPFPRMHQMALVNASIERLPPGFEDFFPNLQHLELTQNLLTEPPRDFPWNPELQHLPHNLTRVSNFHNRYTANELFELPKHVFKRQLVLDKNRITDLTDFEFSGCLDVLSIQWNELREISARTFRNLTCLSFLNLNGNNLTEIPPHSFDGLSGLRNLILSKNRLTEIGADVLGSLTELISLDLADNLLSDISPDTFTSLNRLESLKLQNNRITSVPGNIFRRLSKLSSVDLSGNPIHTFPYEMAFSMEGVRTLSLVSTTMTVFNFTEVCNMDLTLINSALQDGSTVSHVSRQARKIDLSNSTIQQIAVNPSGRRCENTVKLVLCAFQFIFDSSPLHCDPSLFALKNFIQEASNSLDIPCIVNTPSGLLCASPEELRGRPMFSVLPRETYSPIQDPLCPDRCQCYRRQEVLSVIVDCRGLGLSQLPQELPQSPLELWFQDNNVTSLGPRAYLPRVLTLNLTGNALQELGPRVLEGLRGLRSLSLADNLLASLPRDVARLRLARLELHGNPFRCDCHLLWVKAWIRSRPPGLEKWELIKCSAHDGEGQQLQFAEDEDFVCVEVDELRLGLQSGVPAGVALLLLALGVVCYLRRQQLKVWLYVHTGWHPFDQDKAGLEDAHYDACVLCDKELDAWTFREVSQRLERERGCRVFHLWRDVGLGEALHESAARAAGRSLRLVVALEAGVAPWLGAALQQSLAPGRQRSPHFLVLVLHGEPRPPMPGLHPQLQRYVKARRYVNARAPHMFSRLMYHMPQKSCFKVRRRMLEAQAEKSHEGHDNPRMNGDVEVGRIGKNKHSSVGKAMGGLDNSKIIIPDILALEAKYNDIPPLAHNIEDAAGQDQDSGVFDFGHTDGDPNKAIDAEVLKKNTDLDDVNLVIAEKDADGNEKEGIENLSDEAQRHGTASLQTGASHLEVSQETPAPNAVVRHHVPLMERIDMLAPLPAEDGEGFKDLPVFVWYESADFPFLMERVVAPLSRLGVRFLLEDKDFVPGMAKSQNLLQAVAASRCSLLVLSAASLPNEWLLYAYQVALEQHLARRRHRVALLLRSDCPLAALDEELKQALAATAVLEEDGPWFQDNLQSLLIPEPGTEEV